MRAPWRSHADCRRGSGGLVEVHNAVGDIPEYYYTAGILCTRAKWTQMTQITVLRGRYNTVVHGTGVGSTFLFAGWQDERACSLRFQPLTSRLERALTSQRRGPRPCQPTNPTSFVTLGRIRKRQTWDKTCRRQSSRPNADQNLPRVETPYAGNIPSSSGS